MKLPLPILLVVTNAREVPNYIKQILEGTLVEPVVLFDTSTITNRRFSACLVAPPREPLTPEDRFRIHAWLDASVTPRLPAGMLPVWL